MGILKTMQDSDKGWLGDFAKNYKEKRAEAEEKRQGKEKQGTKFFADVRARREESKAENAEKSQKAWDALYRQPEWHPVSDAEYERISRRANKPALIQLESIRPDQPALINPPTSARREEAGGLGIAGEKGVLGFGLLGAVRKSLGLL